MENSQIKSKGFEIPFVYFFFSQLLNIKWKVGNNSPDKLSLEHYA